MHSQFSVLWVHGASGTEVYLEGGSRVRAGRRDRESVRAEDTFTTETRRNCQVAKQRG